MYTIINLHCDFERDNFEQGCIGEGGFKVVEIEFKDSNIKRLIDQVSDFLGADEYEIDQYDESTVNHINWRVVENADGYSPSGYELEQWEQGNIDLYLCNYTAQVFKLEAVNIESELNK
jgi:hypothetical protein